MAEKISARELLDRHGRTYAEEARITLRDKPAPLYQLLVLTTLLSVRIKADIAVAAARELFGAGWRTPRRMAGATWQQRVDALGRAHYVRYDESTATSLGEGAQRVLEDYRGDLRRMRADADGDVAALRGALTGFRRIGDTGAHIFCREAQAVWPELRPYFDDRALRVAGEVGLPKDPKRLADLVAPDELAALSAALVRYGLDHRS
jgi:hypothetical protein